MRNLRFIYLTFSLLLSCAARAETMSLEQAVYQALSTHPDIKSAQSAYASEKSAISTKEWPKDPMLSVMFEKNMNLMQQQMGPMASLGIMQEFEFPAKYYYRGRVQENLSSRAQEFVRQRRLNIRKEVIETYFQLYSLEHIKNLVEAQKETLRQISRIAESRHAIGAVTQQDEMKAHVELTSIENEYFTVGKEEESVRARLALLLGSQEDATLQVSKNEISTPSIKIADNLAELLTQNSSELKQDKIRIQESELHKTLAWYDYAPDFRISARMMVGDQRPADNFAFTVDFSLPIWFLTRQSAQVDVAHHRIAQEKFGFEKNRRDILAKAQDMVTKIQTHERLLNVYDTTLIPQAMSSLRASQTAYQAGKSSFLDLLDAVRTVFAVRVSYYRHLADFVKEVVSLEEVAGTSMSSLPFGEN